MTPRFDIFEIKADGSIQWLEAQSTLETANARLKELAGSGEFFIFDQATKQKIFLDNGSSPTT